MWAIAQSGVLPSTQIFHCSTSTAPWHCNNSETYGNSSNVWIRRDISFLSGLLLVAMERHADGDGLAYAKRQRQSLEELLWIGLGL